MKKVLKVFKWMLILMLIIILLVFLGSFPQFEHKTVTINENADNEFMVVSDTHLKFYSPHEESLYNYIVENNPNNVPIMLVGDIIQDDKNPESYKLIELLAQKYKLFYVTGNHEISDNDYQQVKIKLKDIGVEVLDGTCSVYEGINVCGLDDNYITTGDLHTVVIEEQLRNVEAQVNPDLENILLVHRPMAIEQVQDSGFDLVIAGHAHGGQWRVPFTNISAFAPEELFFPKLTRGMYYDYNTPLLVSSGTSNYDMEIKGIYIPRIFNNYQIYTVKY